MVTKIDNSGFRDWLIQRISAVVIAIYAVWLGVFCLTHNLLSYHVWHHLLVSFWFQLATTVVLLSIIWHAWIGLWTMVTDYVSPKRLSQLVLMLVAILLLGYLVWGFVIVWGW